MFIKQNESEEGHEGVGLSTPPYCPRHGPRANGMICFPSVSSAGMSPTRAVTVSVLSLSPENTSWHIVVVHPTEWKRIREMNETERME